MEKPPIKIVIGKNKIVRKIHLDMKLDKLRESLKDKMPNTALFIMKDGIIEKTEESEFTIKDILKGKEVYCSLNTNEINIYLNEEIVCKLNICIEEKIESLLKEIKDKIPKECNIKYEDTEISFEEAKEQEFLIKDLLSHNSIYFIKKDDAVKNIPKKDEIDKNTFTKNTSENKKFVHIYKNGDVISMTSVDTNNNILSLRELLKDDISDKAKFLSEGIGVPFKDEKSLSLFHIIKEDKIYIEDIDKKESKNQKNSESSEEKIPVILNFGGESNSIIKVSLSQKLSVVREENEISEAFIFTLKGKDIKKSKKKNFQ